MTNQLVEQAEALPDLDEYSALSVRDIAQAIVYWPEGSEEETRAIAAIRSRAPGIGHNRPPLAEAIDSDLEPHRAKAEQLIDIAASSIIIDDESAAKVSDLLALIRALEEELKQARLKRSKPYRDAQKLINDSYERLTVRLAMARGGESGKAGLVGMLTAYDDQRKAKIAAEREIALAEQRKREEEAAAARRRADEAAGQKGAVGAELDAMKAAEEAERAAARASAIRAAPIRSHLGTVARRREPKFQIGDPIKFASWLLEQPTYRNHLLQALQTIGGTIVRSAGVDAVDRGLDIPGLTTWVEQGAASLRR